jgi:hypothetical protein
MRVVVGILLSLSLSASSLTAQARTVLLPFLGSAPETGGQYGVAVLRTRSSDSAGTRPSTLMANAIGTQKAQVRAFVEYDAWSPGNERRSLFTAVFSVFPLPYHGTGDDTPDESEPIEPIQLDVSFARYRKRAADSWRYVGLRGLTSITTLSFVPDAVSEASSFGLPLTNVSYLMLHGTVGRLHDSRDNLFAATSGRVLDLSLGVGALDIKEREAAGVLLRLQADARWYRETKRGSVLAAQALLLGNDGDVPIDQLALLGNSRINRGYTMGRFRDHWMAASQVEWRSPARMFNNRVGVAAFGSVAVLGEEVLQLGAGRLLPAGGAGIRFRLNRSTRSTIRIDYARGRDQQSGLYVAFNEAF